MKFALCLTFLVFSSGKAAAVRNAGKSEIAEIMEKLALIAATEGTIEKLQETPKEARNAEFLYKLAVLKKKREDAYDQAIWLTIRAYDILPFRYGQPALPEGKTFLPSVESAKNQKITWIPVFEDKRNLKIQNEKGEFVWQDNMKDDAANTSSDGVSRMFPEAFKSPVELASFLIHEKIHFEQFTDPRRGSTISTGEMEVQAYGAQKKLMAKGGLKFSAAERKRHSELLDAMIIDKTDQIAREKAILAAGRPLLHVSIVSQTPVQINDLITRARLQVQIAQRDHDERLKRLLLDISQRSCENPGSVDADELAALPRPHGLINDAPPGPLSNLCSKVYDYLSQGGRDSDTVERLARGPIVALPVRPDIPPLRAVPAEARSLFSNHLNTLNDFAVAACNSPSQAPISSGITSRRPFIFETDSDNRRAAELSNGLNGCSSRLFNALIDMTRNGRQSEIRRDWVQSKVAEYSYVAPPPQRSNDPCRENGNIRCP